MDELIAAIQGTPHLAQVNIDGWWRVHPSRYAGDAFNPNPASHARFSPLRRPDGTVLPVMYAADRVEGALMETVFHEAPCPSAGAHLQRADIEAKSLVLSQLNCSGPLTLIDLSSTGLRRMGLLRSQVIDTNAVRYSATRALAQHLYERMPQAQGLLWMSRLFDQSRSVVLFADRIPVQHISVAALQRSVLDAGVEETIMDLIDQLGMRYLS
ncbi:RES family NAD+ phosphorylase [Azohydromonas australica]|uniref:RES family NAD+ phosphorylase n=1 Tax=Azohydromonas australica TaxID=364039 RepID=UPI0004003EC1|nr:RES family NAD+ phosphorylase [Azohydromonas australica]